MILNFMKKVPAGMMIIPLLLGSILITIFPNMFDIGGLTAAVFSSAATNTLLGAQLFCMGTALKVRDMPKVLKRGGVLLLSKFAIGAGLGILIGKLCGTDGFFIACADSTAEAKAIAEFDIDIILAEPTSLIGTGKAADAGYTVECCREIKSVKADTKVMIASGITTGQDVYNCIYNGADGSASTSGIVKARDADGNINTASRAVRVREMIDNLLQAMKDRGQNR